MSPPEVAQPSSRAAHALNDVYPAPCRPSLRLLFAANYRRDVRTGIGNHLVSLAAALERRGHAVDFLMAEEVPASNWGRAARFGFPWQLLREIRQRARSGRMYDLINLHEPSGLFCAAWRKWSLAIPPLVVTTHGVEQRAWEMNPGDEPRSLKTRILWPATQLFQSKFSLRRADAVACLSSDDATYLTQQLGVVAGRIHTLPNGVDADLLTVERRLSDRPGLLFLGSWLARKGARELGRAFAALRKDRPWLTLTVWGAGRPAAAVLADFQLEDHTAVQVVPQAPRSALRTVLAQDQVFVLPSRFEGMPLSLLEAMAAGLPSVTTDTCGMRDLIRNGENGALCRPRDVESLRQLLEQVLDSPARRKAMGEAARTTARQLTWDSVAVQWERLFADVARRPPRRFIVREGRWSDGLAQPPQVRLRDFLIQDAAEKDLAVGNPEAQEWTSLGIRGQILDLGSGTGWKSSLFARANGNWVVSSDVDAQLLRFGKDRYGLRAVCGGAEELPFASNSFDWVLASEVIEHLLRPDLFLNEVCRVLRPGGAVLLTTPNRLQYLRPWRPRWFCLGLQRRIVIEPSHVREFTQDELATLLPPSLRPRQWKFRGTLTGWPVQMDVQELPLSLRRIWAQGLWLIADKTA